MYILDWLADPKASIPKTRKINRHGVQAIS